MSTSSNSTSPWTRRNSAAVLASALAIGCALPALADPSPSPSASPSAAPGPDDPCLQLSNLVSRPSFSTAACVVKPNSLLLQTGYQNQTTSGRDPSTLVTYPQENIGIGIAKNLEFDLNPPSIARISGGRNGVTDGSIGVKVQLGQTSTFTYAVNALYTLQNGTAPYTGAGDGILANLDGSYTLSPAVGLFASFGYNEQSAGSPGAPARYYDFQPSLGASVALPAGFILYAEGFNESSTGPGTGGTFAYDTGLQKDVGSRLQLDAEVFAYPGAQASGHQHALGFGAAYLFGS